MKKTFLTVIGLIAIFTLLGVPAATAAKPPKPLVVPNLDLDATELSFCVTKSGGIKFNTKANCGSKAKEVLLLTSNFESNSLWDSLPNCYAKLQTALEAGLLMPLKTDRDFFEDATGCVVEDIKHDSKIQLYEQMGVPVITDWEFQGEIFGGEGEDFFDWNVYLQIGGTFRFTIANGDILSALDPNAMFCFISHLGWEEHLRPLGDGVYESDRVPIRATPSSFTAEVSLGFTHPWLSNCWDFNFYQAVDSREANWEHSSKSVNDIVIHLDPASFKGLRSFEQQLTWWGW